MKKQKNIIQFTPYFSPHIGGVENVVDSIYLNWIYGESSIVSGDMCQNQSVYNTILGNEKKIFFPSLDIIDNFPCPRFWSIYFWRQLGNIKKNIGENKDTLYILTHTRFFLSSLLGGIFAKYYKIPWIHIEHGSDYVFLSSPIKTKIAYIYDRIIGKWIFSHADKIIAISKASKDFIEKEFTKKEVFLWYRGIDMPPTEIQKDSSEIELVFVGRLVSLKGVETLLEAYKKLTLPIHLTIIGDGPERMKLEQLSQDENVTFLGMKGRVFVEYFLSQKNCILINPSFQEGMPTTVIEAFATKNVVIATNVGGTREISSEQDLLLFSPGDIDTLVEKIIFAEKNYFSLQGKSYSHIRDTFSWEKSLEKLYSLTD